MRWFRSSLMRRFVKGERGQAAVVIALTATSMMALAGTTVEVGHVYYAYQQLVASTNAAALAGAQAMPNTSQASTNVTTYSSQTNELNATPMLTNVVATPTYLCLSTVSNSLDVPCSTSTGASGGYNALSVRQTATVPLWFGGLIGMKQMNIAATAEAAMRGGQNTPWNIAIIEDTTASMNDQDSGAQCSGTQLSCALLGIQTLLGDLYPCQLSQTCTDTGFTAVDSVSLFVFPAVTTATVSDDTTCPTSDPQIVAYTFPDPPTSTVLPSADTYEITGWVDGQLVNNGFVNDYKTTDTSTTLNTASGIVIAAGAGTYTVTRTGRHGTTTTTESCGGLEAPGGEHTYYAQVIYAAQTALAAQQKANPGSKNAMIILTDGDATACATNAYTAGGACNSAADMVAAEGTLNGTGTAATNPSGYNNPTYPSALGECGQAVLAAQTAANAGTTVYTIGYGAETSGGCLSDATYSANVTTNGGSWSPGQEPCQAIAAMASAAVNFYSDDGQGCQATAPSNQSITKLTAIFRAITDNLSTPRLIPNGST